MPLLPRFNTTPRTKETIESLWRLEKLILDTLDFKDVVQRIVDSMLTELGYLKLGYRIIVLALVDEDTKELKRISISQTDEAKKALEVTPVPFHEIIIPLFEQKNICARVVATGTPETTQDWVEILCPPYTPEEARQVQKIIGIKTSMVYPVIAHGQTIGILIFSMVKDKKAVSSEEKDLLHSFIEIVGLAVQNSKLYTSLEETKQKLETANKRLQELDKLKDDFVSVASHELRTPMTAIKSYIWMGLNKKKNELSPELEKYLVRSYISVERLINLVNDMLNISRIEGGRVALSLSEVNLVALAKEVIDEVMPKAQEKTIELSVNESTFPTVICDKDKIHEVYLNLVGNALKFTPKNGQIKIDFKVDGPYLQSSVTDSGVGIAPENLAKLFTKFGRLENSYTAIAESGGTGLGLYISKSLVELHKGKIGASSPGVGRGTTFSFTLPIASSQMGQLLKKEAPKETAETKDLEKTNINVI